MKKIISAILVLSIVFVFAGCSGPNAELTEENITKTVNVAVDALKEFDTEQLDKYVESSTLSYIVGFAEDHEQFAELGRAIFKNLTVDVKSIDIENKTVTVTVRNKDLEQAAYDFTQNLLSNYTKIQLLGKLTNDSWLDSNLSTLVSEIGKAKMSDQGIDVTLTIRQDKKNLVLCFDETAENAVSGGALGAVKSIVG